MATDVTQQRLAAVFFAQVVGYSRLLAADEEAARTLTSYRDAMGELARRNAAFPSTTWARCHSRTPPIQCRCTA